MMQSRGKTWVEGDTCYILVSGKKICICDAAHFDMVKGVSWYLPSGTNPCIRAVKDGKWVTMAKLLYPELFFIKYKDGDIFNLKQTNILEGIKKCGIENGVCCIPLTKGRVAICDSEHFDKVRIHSWALHSAGYAVSRMNDQYTLLHRFLFPELSQNEIDHISGNKLDNRRANVRAATRKQNCANTKLRRTNTTGYKGVSPIYGRIGVYLVQIGIDGKQIHIGYFTDPIKAARAYDNAATEAFGEFARLNFPKENNSLDW